MVTQVILFNLYLAQTRGANRKLCFDHFNDRVLRANTTCGNGYLSPPRLETVTIPRSYDPG